jgi:hypothetical protein
MQKELPNASDETSGQAIHEKKSHKDNDIIIKLSVKKILQNSCHCNFDVDMSVLSGI